MRLLDDSRDKKGRLVQGIPVLGALDEAVDWAKKMEVDDVVLALPSAAHAVRKRITQTCSDARLNVLTIPSLEDVVSGRVSVSSLRRIELDDLLGRDPVALDDSGLHRLLTGHVVMVTGAGGSIGSELCRQIARFAPAKLVLFEQSELALYAMEQELPQHFPAMPIVPVIGDVKNAVWVNQVMAEHQPAVVFHAAAYKHYRGVPVAPPENEGDEVQFDEAPGRDAQAAKINTRIVDLIARQGVSPGDITVLIADALRKADYYATLRRLPLPKPATWLEEGIRVTNTVLIDTIQRFKGLESPIVILWGLDAIDLARNEELLYVGMSRAKSLLVVVGTAATCATFKGAVQ